LRNDLTENRGFLGQRKYYNDKYNWAQWLMPIIPLTQEMDIRRNTIQGQPRQKVSKNLSQPTS
jgi:hypothetical protein